MTINKPANRDNIISDNIKDHQGHYIGFTFDNNGIADSTTYLVNKL